MLLSVWTYALRDAMRLPATATVIPKTKKWTRENRNIPHPPVDRQDPAIGAGQISPLVPIVKVNEVSDNSN